MKKILFISSLVLIFIAQSKAYFINGKYFTLEKCEYGNLGYEYGNVGYYKSSDGERAKVFFGTSWCEY
ncbi:hypothetical protein DMB92_04580 [Campylobacter sp. MIT 99-7217]|uniref:hypothetical protein n=1 Tax=Campylobacter sp. MIT 99-7217 TaxID=535091 RepID=UPI00115754F0|nr:hypothetical protein [Campylobacter sp. MIT 99-7217]TQR32379.1 hypothetical protein DMB92_04580 [Campylobacter sp. MIT 99-7217]